MKAFILFTGSGPIIILTSHSSITDSHLIEKLNSKGIKKFIAYELPEMQVKDKYGKHFDMVMKDLKQTDDLRVLDYDGHHVFYNFSLKELEQPIYHEN